MTGTRRASRSRVRKHTFEYDPDLSRDALTRSWCRWCGLPGEPGDARHYAPEDPYAAAQDEARRRVGDT